MSQTLPITRLNTAQADFQDRLRSMLAFDAEQDESITATVKAILADVRQQGDEAVLRYTERFDRVAAQSVA
ncbi:MAG: histidinol dehydrogenase, partial [Burkholderiaceae bacterium]